MTSAFYTTYWCLPHPEDAKGINRIVEHLALAQGGVVFQPHVSLGTLAGPEIDVEDVVDALIGLILSPTSLGRSDAFTQSLFVRFEKIEQLSRARKTLEQYPGFRSGRAFDPHISLCYGAPKNESAVSSEIAALLGRPVRFDRLRAVSIRLPVETYDHVRMWTEIKTYKL